MSPLKIPRRSRVWRCGGLALTLYMIHLYSKGTLAPGQKVRVGGHSVKIDTSLSLPSALRLAPFGLAPASPCVSVAVVEDIAAAGSAGHAGRGNPMLAMDAVAIPADAHEFLQTLKRTSEVEKYKMDESIGKCLEFYTLFKF
nr:LOW QUALITY PROTEIN: hypothetical protein L203_03193 [Cryptococcus depauperatus CBS 7841]